MGTLQADFDGFAIVGQHAALCVIEIQRASLFLGDKHDIETAFF